MTKITDEMLQTAAKIDDLNEALVSVMDVVGIDDGGVAGMVFSGGGEEKWATADEADRMCMLIEWRKAEIAMGWTQ